MLSTSVRSLLFSLSLVVGVSQGAQALSFALVSEFDGVEPPATYASVDVTQNGNDLDFSITLGGLLGSGEDLHELYFNLVGSFTGLTITADNAPRTAYSLSLNPSVVGGAGSSFAVGVNFGNGGGPPGNGALKFAKFTLSADQALTPAALLVSSFANGGVEAQIAAHIQGTSTAPGSETVGGVVPEASLAGLLVTGALVLRGLRGQR